MFIRTKQQHGRVYHYLVTSERHEGRVRQKTLAYLGEFSSIEAALEGLPALIAKRKKGARVSAPMADTARQQMHPAWIERNAGEVPRPRRGGSQYANKLFGSYWYYHERARLCAQRACDCAARLDKLRAAIQAVAPTNVSPAGRLWALQPKRLEAAGRSLPKENEAAQAREATERHRLERWQRFEKAANAILSLPTWEARLKAVERHRQVHGEIAGQEMTGWVRFKSGLDGGEGVGPYISLEDSISRPRS